MKAHWWCCVVGLLCVPPWVKSTSTVSQDPVSISLTRVNSSAGIGCSTSRPEPLSLTLYRGFPAEETVVFLVLESGRVTRETPAVEFVGRIRVAQRAGPAVGFTLQLSLLGPRDTNLYYCLWGFFNLKKSSRESLRSAGTVIVVRERDPQELCKDQVFDRILIALSAAAFSIVVGLCIAALVVKRKQFKRSFRPARGATPPARPNRPVQAAPRDDPYLFTYVNSLDVSAIVEC